jgi:hypothetical protein
MKSSIEVLTYNEVHQIWAQNNPYIFKSGIQYNANTDGDYYLYISTTYISIKQLINLNEIVLNSDLSK